jgi:hypothetical protein
VTTYRGHWNAWGIDGWFDFRDDSNAGLQQEMARAAAAGALVSINHPRPFGPDWNPGLLRGAPVVEVWNGQWERLNVVSLGKWDTALTAGQRLVAVGGSDTHHLHSRGADPLPPALGEPTTWVQIDGELTVGSVLDAIRAGRCFIAAGPNGPQLYLRPSGDGLTVRAVDAEGGALLVIGRGVVTAAFGIDRDDWSIETGWPAGSSYARAQLVDGLGRVYALSNALWREAER